MWPWAQTNYLNSNMSHIITVDSRKYKIYMYYGAAGVFRKIKIIPNAFIKKGAFTWLYSHGIRVHRRGTMV